MMQHFMNNTFSNLDYQKMSSAAVLMALVMVALIALLFKVEDVFGKDVASTSATSSSSLGMLFSAAMKRIMLYPRFFHKNSTTMTSRQ